MAKLEEIRNGASVRGIASSQVTQIVSVDWIGDQAINVVYRDVNGAVAESVLYRDDEHRLHVEVNGRPWSFDGDGALLRLVTEANRIKLAHYFDPYLAIHTSLVDPLPHQISAVYGEMLPRQPLRFLLPLRQTTSLPVARFDKCGRSNSAHRLATSGIASSFLPGSMWSSSSALG